MKLIIPFTKPLSSSVPFAEIMKPPQFSTSHYLLFIFIFILFTSSYGQENQQYLECYESFFGCGQVIQGITYPFWGGSRPSHCGLEQFHLTCNNNGYTTIDIDAQIFRVLHIYQFNRTMRIARNDLSDDVCPPPFTSTTLNHTFFAYRPDYQNLTLFYDCDNDIDPRLPNTIINCSINGVDRRGFYAEEPFSSSDIPNVERCNMNMTVPVLSEGIEEFRDNNSMQLRDLVNWGFDVQYIIDNTDCLACQTSGARCWINTTISPEEATCVCPDGIGPLICTPPPSGRSGDFKLKIAIGLIGTGIALFVVLFACVCICCIKKSSSTRSVPFWGRKTEMDKNVEEFIRQHGSSTPKRYKYSDIKKITNSLKEKLGQGGYGSVYKGRLTDGRLVAVKILNAFKGNGEDFINEVASIGRTSHVNVVTLLGFCYECKKRALVYEFLWNGSLDKFIYNGQHLGGEKLYQIALGIARGLEYLHRGCNTRILHFDIKPHNILLDQDFIPKIADFGLAKRCHGKDSIVSMAEARGTIGYIAPEVFSRNFGGVSHKSDVYSYGMMVLEMVGGRRNVDAGVVHTSEIYFPHWIYKRLELNEDLHGLTLIQENEIARRMLIVGLWCIQTDPMHRPPMNKVIEMLEGNMEALEIPPKPFLSSPPRSPPPIYSSTSSGN
ncbi:hypothetical protein LguiA_027896 [Lonicera macranthoides]